MIQKRRAALGTVVVGATTALVMLGAVQINAQSGPDRGPPGGGQKPSEAMLKACSAKQADDPCSTEGPEGKEVAGSCFAPAGMPLACRPSGGAMGPANRPPQGQNNLGTPIESTRAQTFGVLCGAHTDIPNEQIGLQSEAKWSCERGQRLLVSNGIPDHAIGVFPNPGNPNSISVQSFNFAVTVEPVAHTGSGMRVKDSGFALNGVPFDPGTAERCPDGATDAQDCRGQAGKWSIEALGQSVFDFGTDENHAHVQPGGKYHYHGIPEAMLSAQTRMGKSMQLIGWAADGFPIYARYGHDLAKFMTSALRPMKSSYRLKPAADAGRPSTAIIAMGAFTQDYEYVAGLGDLDECNGRFGVTPEFPEGIYHYYATDSFPFVQRCVKGSTDSQPTARREQQRGEGGGRRGKGNGKRPPRGEGRR
ncbi:YHYH protein [uncultured Parasphingorhabdus sp.]|uniref:YHYH protein n=1 Tax=uncultured Parasphingorhabdus sp. TaxID=2709694 RepID=UPI002AA63BE3|nr:YHYH protein [uncultured Parasphingorhabdus sp.]